MYRNEISDLLNAEYARFKQFPNEKTKCESFQCSCKVSCNVDLIKEATYSPAFGDEGSKYMVIAESPSTSGGKGCYLTGSTVNILEESKKSHLQSLINFIKTIDNNKYPYFKDIIKCGLEITSNKKKLNIRKKNCINKFLIKEIEIVDPETIVCIGRFSFDEVMKLKGFINDKIKITQITHYSNRASLTLNIKDKKEIIWPLELGLIKTKKEAASLILKLEYLLRKYNHLE